MSKVEKTLLEDNVFRISITLENSEIQSGFNQKLKEYRKTAQWKGFRKGTAPLPFVKKMVGPQIFYDLIDKLASDALFAKIDEEKLNYIGSPIPADDVEPPVVKMDMKEDITFAYDIAIVPEFEVKEPTMTFDYFKVSDLEDVAKKEMEQARISMGKEEIVEANFDETASMSVKLVELDGKKPKEGGLEHNTTLAIKDIEKDDLKKKLAKAKVGDTFNFDPFSDLAIKDEKYVAKIFLGKEDDYEGELPQKLSAEIVSATHKVPAEMDQAFFDGLFGPGVVKTEKEALEKFVEFFEGRYKHESDQMLLANWKKELQDANQLTLPSKYIKKVILKGNPEATEEAIEKDLPLIEKDLVWSTVRSSLLKKYEVPEASEHDIQHAIAHSIGSQYGIDPHNEIIANIARETMQKDKSKVEATFYGIMEGRLFDTLKDDLKTKEIMLSKTEFEDKIKEVFSA